MKKGLFIGLFVIVASFAVAQNGEVFENEALGDAFTTSSDYESNSVQEKKVSRSSNESSNYKYRVGAQLGTNMESADGYAFVGGVHADSLVFPNAGILIGMQMDFTAASKNYSANSSWYFEWLIMNDAVVSPFVKANLGMYVLYDDDVAGPHQAGAYFALSAGANISLPEELKLI